MKGICSNTEINKYFMKDPNAFYTNENRDRRSRSIHFGSFRFNKAQEEAKKTPVCTERVISYVNEFLDEIGVSPVLNPIMRPNEISYTKIKQDYELEEERDILWIKFTSDGYAGVIAQSNDINFIIPQSAEDYNKVEKGTWRYNTSGIIVHKLHKTWDESFVLVFPLKLENVKYNRHEIETGVGNYLIDKGVPILDYYSHNY